MFYITNVSEMFQTHDKLNNSTLNLSILTLIVETIDAIDWGTFMVTPEQKEVLRIFDFIGQQKADGLEWLFAPIHIVPKEQVITFRRIATIFKEPQQIIVLSMDVTCKEKSKPI